MKNQIKKQLKERGACSVTLTNPKTYSELCKSGYDCVTVYRGEIRKTFTLQIGNSTTIHTYMSL